MRPKGTLSGTYVVSAKREIFVRASLSFVGGIVIYVLFATFAVFKIEHIGATYGLGAILYGVIEGFTRKSCKIGFLMGGVFVLAHAILFSLNVSPGLISNPIGEVWYNDENGGGKKLDSFIRGKQYFLFEQPGRCKKEGVYWDESDE